MTIFQLSGSVAPCRPGWTIAVAVLQGGRRSALVDIEWLVNLQDFSPLVNEQGVHVYMSWFFMVNACW